LRAARTPETLTHVTGSFEALESILESRSIWARPATDVKGDNAELSLGEELALDVARRMRAAERRPHACLALDEFLACYSRERISVKAEVFIACFTPRAADVHWKTYGGGAEGFAITFNILRARQPDHEVDHALVPVLYDTGEAEKRLRAGCAQGFKAAARLGPREMKDALRGFLLRCAAVIAVQLKDRRFAAEQEWRIAAIPHWSATRRIVALPWRHVAIPLNPDAMPDIQEICIGPKCASRDTLTSHVRAVLERCGYTTARVVVR
jgi:hypothetical protein